MNTYEQSQLVLWESYCDKKMECVLLREKLEEALSMLKESSTLLTCGTQEHCYNLAHDIEVFVKECSVGQEEINQ